jgi:purine nucleoside permease
MWSCKYQFSGCSCGYTAEIGTCRHEFADRIARVQILPQYLRPEIVCDVLFSCTSITSHRWLAILFVPKFMMLLSLSQVIGALLFSSLVATSPVSPRDVDSLIEKRKSYPTYKIKPKVFIISMFEPEAEIWWDIPEFDLLARNITVPGFSPLFPDAHCTADENICQLVTGESEINAAVTVASLVASTQFDLTSTYFLLAGIAGVNPEVATVSSVIFARYAIQIALQYEFDIREIPANYSTGYIPQGSTRPDEYPQSIYGTEVFEVNDALRKLAVRFAQTATLNDSNSAVEYRALYNTTGGAYAAGVQPPSVVECDVATSDVYYSGKLLGDAFGNYTRLVTNGTGNYCASAQEDNATLEAMIRAAAAGILDFSRIMIMRTGSDMDRPYPGQSALTNLLVVSQGAFEPAIRNLYIAGVKVIEGILNDWGTTFEKGVNATNYVGDIFGTIGGKPDFGPGAVFEIEDNNVTTARRSIDRRRIEGRRKMKGRRGWSYRLGQ